MRTVVFQCPRGGNHNATLYPSGQAGCAVHGWLLYTEIPHDALVAMKKKIGGWKTLKDISNDLKHSIVRHVAAILKGTHG